MERGIPSDEQHTTHANKGFETQVEQSIFSQSIRCGYVRILFGVVLLLSFSMAHAQEHYQLQNDQWVHRKAFAPGTPEAQLQAVRKLVAQKKGKAAVKAAQKWIKTHPDHPLLDEAYLVSGDAKVLRKHYFKALFDYELLIRKYPASEYFHVALEREYEIAKLFASGVKRRWMKMRIFSAAGEAEEIFIRIQERAPGSRLGEQAMLSLGEFYFNRGEMASAAEAYQLFLENYPQSVHRQRVMLRQIEADLASFKGPTFDPTGLIDAREHIKRLIQAYPASAERMGADALLIRITDSMALKDFYTAQWYETQPGGAISARYMYERVIRDYPQTHAARQAEKRMSRLSSGQSDQRPAKTDSPPVHPQTQGDVTP